MKPLFIFILSLNFLFLSAQSSFTVAFYNVENLFDTINSNGLYDFDFSPEGKYNWDTYKYYDKVEKIGQVLTAIDSSFPDLVGLCEIENRSVLEDVVNQVSLKKAQYKIIHEDSPDNRGIDVALIYKPNSFTYLWHKALPVNFEVNQEIYHTRDILYVKGTAHNQDTLHVFVNHWPSRRGGAEESSYKREKAAKILRQHVDSLLNLNLKANILIMGDFNDNPDNKSIEMVLNAKEFQKKASYKQLINLHASAFKDKEGTLVFQNQWFLFDQIIISKNLLANKKKGIFLKEPKAHIFKADFILFTHKDGSISPNRTYVGNRFVKGFSDHLPVYVKFISK